MSGGKLTLFCLVYPNDDPLQHLFVVDIDKGMTVAHLKQAIKAEKSHELDQLDADALKLWKVSIPANDKLKQHLQGLRFDGTVDDATKLEVPVRRLSSIFPDGVEEMYLHIIVENPQKGVCGYFMAFVCPSDVWGSTTGSAWKFGVPFRNQSDNEINGE